MSTPQRVVVLAPAFPPGQLAGGPVRSVGRLVAVEAQARPVLVIAPARDLGQSDRFPGMGPGLNVREYQGAEVWYLGDRDALAPLRACAKAMRRDPGSILYINSFFSPAFSILPILALAMGLLKPERVIVAPRGEFGSAALGSKRWKKRPVMAVLRALIGRRVTWHATSGNEWDDIRRHIGSSAQTVLRDNLWPAPVAVSHGDRGARDRLRILFVGRIVPIKGLVLALQELALVRSEVDFLIAGNVEDREYWGQCLREIETLPGHVRVEALGHQTDPELERLYASADILLLPTQGENFGHAIAESLAAGLSVIIPDTTPWTRMIEDGAGAIMREPGDAARAIDAWASAVDGHLRRSEVLDCYRRGYEESQGASSLFDLA
jgi:glycosyltransferase involved in cell wall biosynthesis